jgi:tRNA 2-thiouridine synthesizing protein C
MKSFLFVMQSAAYEGDKVQEVLDAVLIAAAFDQQVSLLLLDDAVFHLKNHQQNDLLAVKDISAIYRSLELYDIETIYIERESLVQRGLSLEDLLIPTKTIDRAQVAQLLQAYDVVLSG